MRKVLLTIPLTLALVACGNEETKVNDQTKEPMQIEQANEPETAQQVNDTTTNSSSEVDARLSEPTEDTHCSMCNMKVYTKDDEMGVFAAQAIKSDGSVVFYDDIGCLLNDEYVNQIENEKFVRDFNTLNWFNVEEAFIVKTDLKSPMNWGYIFFKSSEDADAYVKEHHTAKVTPIAQVREEAIQRHKNKEAHNHSSEGNHMDMNKNMDEGEISSTEESHE